jgi:alkylation response protein AidB-like acyl-CoA dehydrogenase
MTIPFSPGDFKIELKEEHELLRQSVRELCETKIRPYVEKGEKERYIPPEVRAAVVEAGLMGFNVKPEYGGQGADILSQAIATEEMTRVWTSLSTHVFIHWLFSTTLQLFGSERQRSQHLPEVASGKAVVAFANTEPGGGSDVAGMKTTAKRVDSRYIINGRKTFITNGGMADRLIVTARTSVEEKRWRGISMFLVGREHGFKVESRIETSGIRASNTAQLLFEDVSVPAENLVGEEGNGFKQTLIAFDYSRVAVAAQAVGLAQAALESMLSYSSQREAFGQPIVSYQMVQERIADSLAEVQASRLLTYFAASLLDRGDLESGIVAASMAKFYSTEVAERVASRAIELHGGYGVSTSVERFLRDAQVLKTYEGTNMIQRITVLRQVMKKHFGVNVR